MGPIFYTKHSIDSSDLDALKKTLDSGWLTQGPAIEEFENEFKKEVNAPFAFAVNNGTSALHLATMALGLTSDQKVLVTSLSFVATANCVRYQGAQVEFVDIDPSTYNIDLKKLKTRIEDAPKDHYAGVIVVDFAGRPVETDSIYPFLKERNMWLIRDASHSPGSSFKTQKGSTEKVGACNFADVSTFSFHPAKHIACGEGGMVTTRNPIVAEKLKLLRTHGIAKDTSNEKRPWFQNMKELGFNFRISDINAALGTSQTKKLKKSVERRNEIASKYTNSLKEIEQVCTPVWPEETTHALHLYVITADNRDELFLFLKENNIHCQIHYTPIYRMDYYKNFGYKDSDYPETEKYFERCISLPMFPSLKDEEQDFIIKKIYEFYSK